MGVAKKKTKKEPMTNGKVDKNGDAVKKKKKVSCLQCIKSPDDGGLEGKYRVAAPELMQDTFMSDSEDEGGEVECPIQQQQQYRYMNSEAGTLQRARPVEDSVADGHLWPSNNDGRVSTMERQPVDIGFLVSFVVDARGGAMRAKRRGGVRIVVPPAACAAPTRVTCRAATRRAAAAAAPPPLMEGEALASRLLELQPQGAKFLAPVVIEVPIYTASSPEREIVVLRSDTGETWQDHYLHNNDNPCIQEALTKERLEYGPTGETIGENGQRVTRVVTCDFPHYLAVVSRVRQQVHIVGVEGGTVSSSAVPQVQALFPPSALTKRIRVGLQAHVPPAALAARLLPRSAAVSPVLTVEPRRRKFHRSITLTVPLPVDQATNTPSSQNLRLLCSIMGGAARAVWEDVTGSTPLTVAADCASFTTTVSARFWLMSCQNVSEATKLATELYREMLLVPFEIRLVVLGKRLDAAEGRLLVTYVTDRHAYDTLLQQEHYVEVATSTAVQLRDARPVHLEFSGNLLPVTKCATQPSFVFEAFKDNRVEFPVRVKHHGERPAGRIYFMNEPKVGKGEQSQAPACVLDVELPGAAAPRPAGSAADCLNLDQSGFDALNDELSSSQWEHTGPASLPHTNGHDTSITNGDVKHVQNGTDVPDTKPPQANGGTVHVDSNKTKATFDSDEDKTPHNTLEKGKKKDGFLGGLADKVKNVFTHEDDDKTKESSPKPQPKPREEKKEKSPPKPAPRIIQEDLLDKVEDMFKDLHSKPPREEEVFQTRLVVDEDEKLNPEDIYANRQPIDTPDCNKKSDPFQNPKCCDKGPQHKHTHEETSNLVDMIEQEAFTQKEKIQELEDRLTGEIEDGKDKLEKEKQNIQQKSNAVIEDIKEKSEKVKNDLEKEGHGLLSDAQKGFDHMSFIASEQSHTAAHLAQEAENRLKNKTSDIEAAAKDTIDSLEQSLNDTKNNLKDQANKLKNKGQDKASEISSAAESKADALRHKAHEIESDVKDKVNSASDSANKKAAEFKDGAKTAVENAKDATNEKLNKVSESVEDAKKKAKNAADDASKKAKEAKEDVEKEVQKKKKKGKNFIGGLVSNIFGEKEKIEKEVEGKISEAKNKANDLKQQAEAKKDDIVKQAETKTEDFVKQAESKRDDLIKQAESKKDDFIKQAETTKDDLIKQAESKKDDFIKDAETTKDDLIKQAESKKEEVVAKKDELVHQVESTKDDLVHQAEAKKNEVVEKAAAKKEEVENALVKKQEELRDGAENLVQRAHDRTEELSNQVQNKTSEVTEDLKTKKDELQTEAKSHLDSIIKEAEQTTEDIKKSAESALNSAADKKAELLTDVETLADAGLQRTQETLGSFEKLESTAKDNLKSDWEDLQSSTRDTYANIQDDVTSLENSAQDTLHSFQSSAGNTFDSLEDSARETYNQETEKAGNLFGEAKDTFEGFQVSADNKLEDVRGGVEAARGEADQFTSSLNNLGSEVFGLSGKGFMKDSSTKLLDSEKAASSPHKKSSGIPKLKKKKK